MIFMNSPAYDVASGLVFLTVPAEVLINTGSRTALQYLMSPITDNVHRALRED